MTLALQSFADKLGPAVNAAWLNEVDQKRQVMNQPAGANGSIIGLCWCKQKAAATGRNTNTAAADPDLQFTVEPGTYRLTAFLSITGITTSTQGFLINIGSTAGTGFGYMAFWGMMNSTQVIPQVLAGAGGSPVQFANISTGPNDFLMTESIVANNTTGVISVQWAARASGGNNAQVNAQSWAALMRLA
jgi:hypothetical protein